MGRPFRPRAPAGSRADRRRRRHLQLAGKAAPRRDRRARLAALDRRPPHRCLSRSRLRELAQNARRGGVMRQILLALVSLAIAAGAAAQPAGEAAKKATGPSAEAVKKSAKPAATKARAPKPGVRPAWAELTTEQQQVLAPLKADWDTLEPERRLKWIAIAKRYPRMKTVEQERVQRRMQTWVRLTPEQRRVARENYKQLAKAAPRQAPKKNLSQAWAEY